MPQNVRVFAKGLILIATLALIGWALEALGLRLDESFVDSEIRGQGLHGELIYVGIATLLVAVGVPRQGVSFMGGYAFGFWIGSGLAVLATVLGCIVNFFYARFFGRAFVQRRFGARVAKVDRVLGEHPLTTTLLIRFLPVGNNLLTNMVAGVSSVRPLPFFVGSALGYVPQTAVFTLLGSGFQVDPLYKTGMAVLLFVLSAALGLFLYRTFRTRRHLDDVMQAGPGDATPS